MKTVAPNEESDSRIRIEIPADVQERVQKTAKKLYLTLTERAIVKKIAEALSKHIAYPENFLRHQISICVRQFRNEVDVPLQKISLMPLEHRFELLLKLRLIINEALAQVTLEHQHQLIYALNQYFNQYVPNF